MIFGQPKEPHDMHEGARSVSVRLFGRMEAWDASGKELAFSGARTRELLGYLLLFRERAHHREVLAGTLWPESTTSQSRKYLRQALWSLRVPGLGTGAGKASGSHSEWLQIDASQFWLDVAELENAYAPVRLIPGELIDPSRAGVLKRAVKLYQGDLLEGWYQDWCVFERERLKALYLSMLEKLLGYCEAHGDPEEGLIYGTALLRHERAHERAHWRLMRLHYLVGDRTAALRQFEQCRQALREELQTAPGERLQKLYGQIRADEGLEVGPDVGISEDDSAPREPESAIIAGTKAPLEQALSALALATRLLEEGLRTAQAH